MQAPVLVLNEGAKRESGRKAQLGNVAAGQAVADIIRSTLGPRAMLKMVLDPMGGIVLTSDGNVILRELDVSHPAAKSLLEVSRSQAEEAGDGTTTVVVLAGSLLSQARPFLERDMHPRHLVFAYMGAMDAALEMLERIAIKVDLDDREQVLSVVQATVGTTYSGRHGDLIAKLAVDAVSRVAVDRKENGGKVVDIKRYARVERVPGGYLSDCTVLDGVCLNKDVTHPKMRRRIRNPRIILLDSPLEFKKGESQTNIEITKESDFEEILRQEEEYVKRMCDALIALKPDMVFTEKGVSDLAQHFLMKANITVLRRLRKTDNNRIARATGATICHEPADVKESDVGTQCGLFEVRKIADEYFTYLVECKEPKACTILLRGASKDVLSEISRNLDDAMGVARNLFLDPRVVPGGGASELAMGKAIRDAAKKVEGVRQFPFRSVATALEQIPQTLIENCGAKTIRVLTELRAKHARGEHTVGVNGHTGEVTDMAELKIWEAFTTKSQTVKSSVEAACMLLRIDDIVSGTAAQGGGAAPGNPEDEDQDTFGDMRDG